MANLSAPSGTWNNLLVGAAFDTPNDQQSNSDNDLVGDATRPLLQAQASGSGEATVYYFRARMGDTTTLQTTLYLGFDLNQDGRVDIFIEANVKAQTPYVSFHKSDPSKSGVSPSTTGWQNSSNDTAIELRVAATDAYIAQTAATGDVDGNNKTDSFIDFGFTYTKLKAFAQTLGFDTLSPSTVVSLFLFTSTGQTANGDIGGLNDNTADLTASWSSLGIVPSGSLTSISSGSILTPTVDSLSTNDTTPTLTGTWGGTNGGTDTLSITVNSASYTTSSATAISISGYNWSLTLPTTATGTYAVTATTTRVAGGVTTTATDTTSNELTIVALGDTTAPTLISSTPADNATSVSIGTNIVLNFSENVVAGPGYITLYSSSNIVEVFDPQSGKGSYGGTLSISGSTVTVNPGVLLANSASYNILIDNNAIYDTSGNAYAGITDATALNFQSAADPGSPSAPTVTALTTSDTTPLISGTWGGYNAGNDSLTVTVNNVTYTTATTPALTISGTDWSLQLNTLSAGTYSVVATASRTGGGNTSDSTSNELVIDTAAPSAPTISTVTDNVGSVTGTVATGGRTDDTVLVLTGTAEANSTVKIYDGSNLLGTATANGSGAWTFTTSTLSDATTYAFNATATDAAGNVSSASSNYTVTVDTSAPSAPTISAITDDVSPVTGTVANNGSTNDTVLVLTGTAEANSTVTIYNGSTSLGTATADGSGAWTYTTGTLSNGTTYDFNAKATDAAGNVSSASSNYTVTVDTSAPAPTPAPAAPTISAITDNVGSVTGTVATGGRTDDTQLVLTGTAEANSTVTIYNGATSLGTATANGSGAWSFTTATLSNGTTYTFNATATDAAGNVSSASSNYTVTVDTSAPSAPTISAVTDNVGSVTGTVATGGRTDDTVLVLTGTAEANSTVTIYNGSTSLGTATADGSGAWTYTTGTLSNGTTYDFNAKATDAAGNVSAVSSNYAVTIDTVAPSAPSVAETGSMDLSDNIMDAAEAVSTTFRVSFGGTGAMTGDTVAFLLNGSAFTPAKESVLTTTDISRGYVDFVILGTDLGTDGLKELTAFITDSAGNVGANSSALRFSLHNTGNFSYESYTDAYVMSVNTTINIEKTLGTLAFDYLPEKDSAALVEATQHGQLSFSQDGSFRYVPDLHYFGVDKFSYSTRFNNETTTTNALIYVTPLTHEQPARLDFRALPTDQKVAALYVAYFGRGADRDGFDYWVNEFQHHTRDFGQDSIETISKIANSFAKDYEANEIYPFYFLHDMKSASDAEIDTLLNAAYENLFNRRPDTDGLHYWTDQTRPYLSQGKDIGYLLVDMMSGAQNSDNGKDIDTLISKVAVSLYYVEQQRIHDTHWTWADDLEDAQSLISAVTDARSTVLLGVIQAEQMVFADLL